MENLKITVAIVTFNAEKTLRQTLDNVFSQDYSDKEVLVIDGKSTDDTLKILSSYGDNLHFVSEKDHGVYDAMNKAFNYATGDYIIFLGADDCFINEKVLSNFSELISTKPKNKIYYGNVIKTSGNYRYDGEFNSSKLGIKNICHQSIFYPKNIYKTDSYELKYRLLADYVYNIKHFNDMSYINLDVAIYNNISGISSVSKDREYIKDQYKLIIKYLGFVAFFRTILFKIRYRLNLKDKYMDNEGAQK